MSIKNIQVIDGALNCCYDIYSLPEEDFNLIFPNETDIAFIDEVMERVDSKELNPILKILWNQRQKKTEVAGIHGTLFYGCDHKKKYYPTRREEEMVISL